MGQKSFSFMDAYGANVAGFFWNTGTALQFILGLVAQSPREIASSIFNVASPCTYMFLGHKNWGVAIGGTLGIIGTFLAVEPQIMHGETASIFGFISFCIFVSLGIFSPQLTRKFGSVKNIYVKRTLGSPRRLAGLGPFFFTRIPIIFECITHERWKLAAVFALWGLGDLALSFSKPRIKRN